MKNILVIYQQDSQYGKFIAENILVGIMHKKVNGDVQSIARVISNVTLLNNYDAIVLGSPTYFGSVSSQMKCLMDKTLNIWEERLLCDKICAGYTYSSAINGDKFSTLLQMFVFAQQHGMVWVGLDIPCCYKNVSGDVLNRLGSWIGLMGQTPNKFSDDSNIQSDKKTAQYFGSRIAQLV